MTENNLEAVVRLCTTPLKGLARYLFTAATSEMYRSGGLSMLDPVVFHKLGQIDTSGIMEEVRQVESIKTYDAKDRVYPSVQNLDTIYLWNRQPDDRFARDAQQNCTEIVENSMLFPKLTTWAKAFAQDVGKGEISQLMISRLGPNSEVYEHVDFGTFYLIRDRYHLVLQTTGSKFTCTDQEITMHDGEIWWFNNNLRHKVQNIEGYRYHVILDVLPDANLPLANRINEMNEAGILPRITY